MKKKNTALLLALIGLFLTPATWGQNLVINGDFNQADAFFITGCLNIEAQFSEATYGGTDATNMVGEVDDESCFYQDVCILSGVNYIFSMKASRRTGNGGSPDPLTTHLRIEGLNAANTVVGAPLVSLNFVRTNTTFALTPVTGIPVVTIPAGSPIVRLRISLRDSTAGNSTLGMIVDDLNLSFQTPPAYAGALLACQFSPTTVDITNLPTTGVFYNWSMGNGATPATATIRNPVVTWNSMGIKPVRCILSNGVCDVDTIRANVDVQSFPAAPVLVSPVNYCQGEPPAPLNASPATGNRLIWYAAAVGGPGSNTAPVISTNVTGTTTYYVSQANTACGEGPRVPIIVNVGTKPPPPVVVTPIIYCQGDMAIPLAAIGTDLKWYSQPVGGTGMTIPPVPATLYEDTLVYWVTQSNNGCESIRSRQEVQVRFKPNGVLLGTQASICQGSIDTFEYFGSARSGSVYDFKVPAYGTTVISGSGAGPYIVRFDSAGTFPVRMQVSDNGCVSDEMIFTVTVRPSPEVAFSGKKDACINEVVTFALYYTSGSVSNYSYDFDNGDLVYGTATGGPYGVKWPTPGEKVISLRANTIGCLSRTTYDTIYIHAPPDASFTASTTNICSGDSIVFQARETDSNTRFIWTPDYFFSSGNNYQAIGVVKAQGPVKLTVTSRWGCTSADSIYITARPCCELFFPNAFSPNNDGRNDVFKVVTTGHHEIASFRILNRWGQTVFETRDERRGWDGTFNGKDQDVGTYFYYIKYICQGSGAAEQKGELLLMR
jgi:gliding motility-associated-like protein